ncbi:hypothetical protein K2173_018989 [Erythroxylum novogranatense]|uniref:Reverse transcriptase Ty1/copia-type domain-containing protein n=1 Tax=Erythroxylum novogranatense TaxID=1862640 RepID=A0AAV8ST62_9ROSI|nr:hypothetical protein K2173_018989 [Erythroxylum novogranatense]
MDEEIEALEMNRTWDITDLPEGKKPIGCKWIFKVKLKENGKVDIFKARLVAKGYNQIEGFTIKDLQHARYFLGLEITRSENGIYFNQRKYALDLIQDAGTDDGPKLEDPYLYRKLVGRLLYLGYTIPDLAHATQQLSQYVHDPRQLHLRNALHVLRYIKNRPSLGLKSLIGDFQVADSIPIPLHCDNQAALHITANPVFHERTKHLDIDCHIVRE